METFIKNLARGAGAILRDGFKRKLEISHKQDFWDVVTQYDLASENYIVERIKKKFPAHSIIAEESGEHLASRKQFWVIDPLDGTRNFSRGIPFFCVSIAFVKDGQILYGAVYDPMHDELFFAGKGKGAALNGQPITVSPVENLQSAFAAFLWCREPAFRQTIKKLHSVILEHEIWNVPMASAALALAYTAAGRYDFFVGKGCYPWDYSAGALIAVEAGARVTDFEGGRYKWNSDGAVAANPVLHKKIMKELGNK